MCRLTGGDVIRHRAARRQRLIIGPASCATAHRRLREWQLATLTTDRRRWVRADQVDLVRHQQAADAAPNFP